jgi:protein ImuA
MRAHQLAVLRQTLAKLENVRGHGRPEALPFDVLPNPGFTCGVLHEIAAAEHGDKPAAFGFVCALIASALQARPGPGLLIATRRALADFGRPYGLGLRQQGLDTRRLLLIETRTGKDALWAIEEALRSDARPAIVAGIAEGRLDLTASRRLNLAAAVFGTPLVLQRTEELGTPTAAATRWRIGAAPLARDRFGAFAGWRWHAALERCRNGRPGRWLIEWCHVTHRFRLAAGVADRPPAAGAGRRAG